LTVRSPDIRYAPSWDSARSRLYTSGYRVGTASAMLLLLLSCAPAAEENGDTETRIKVHEGTILIDQKGTKTRLTAGDEARLTKETPARVKKSSSETRKLAKPIAVRWEPGRTVVTADDELILLRKIASGSEGQSDSGRYAARLSTKGELTVADLLFDRQSVRLPEGKWIHRFADHELHIEPSGRKTMHKPDGRRVATCDASTKTPPESPPPSPLKPWEVGIRLDKKAAGLRVQAVDRPSPAQKAGFQPGDEILAIGDIEAPKLEQIRQRLRKAQRGDQIPFTVLRGGRKVVLTVEAGVTGNGG